MLKLFPHYVVAQAGRSKIASVPNKVVYHKGNISSLSSEYNTDDGWFYHLFISFNCNDCGAYM